MADDSSTAATRARSDRKLRHGRRKEDSISSLPDMILQHILCFNPTKFAIRTSILSKRWRHVWCETPCLSFHNWDRIKADSINETLACYTAPKILSFHLFTTMKDHVPHIDKWIDFSISRYVEKLSLILWLDVGYTVPESFYINSSVKELTLTLKFADLNPKGSVSWTSLKTLSLNQLSLSDESLSKILCGCPILQSLSLYSPKKLRVIDLSKSLRLRTLQVYHSIWVQGPMQIVAPHIHCLILTMSQLPCTLVDVSSLTEAKLNICQDGTTFDVDHVQNMMLKILEKVHKVEKLNLGGNFLQILSLAELRGVPFPMLKVKALTLDTVICQYVIPGIERILLNSPDLNKLVIYTNYYLKTIKEDHLLDQYLALQGLNPENCWRSKDGLFWNKSRKEVEAKHVASFVELMLKNTKKLEKMVVHLEKCYRRVRALKKMVPTSSYCKNVSIVHSNKWFRSR